MSAAAAGTQRETLHVVVAGSFEGQSQLSDALGAADSGLEVTAWTPDVQDLVPYLAADDLGAVLIGTGLDGTTVEADVAVVRKHTGVPVLLLVPEDQLGLIETALAASVDDVLLLPQRAEVIAFAIHKARQNGGGRLRGAQPETPETPRGRVVTVFSPKGGTGKTVLSTNLAAYLAANSGKRVLLIDLDLQFGDAAIMLGVDPKNTMHELVLAPGELDAGKLAAYTTRHKSGLDLLAAPMRPEDAELVTESKVLRMLEVAREAYDLVVVDTSPFFYGPMLAVLQPTDQLLLLCGLDVPTLKNVKLSLRTLEQLGFPSSRTSLVLNRVTSNVGLTKGDVESALGVHVAFEIPNDPVVAPAVNRGASAAICEEASEFAQAVGLIAAMLEPAGVAPVSKPVTASKWRWPDLRHRLEGRAT